MVRATRSPTTLPIDPPINRKSMTASAAGRPPIFPTPLIPGVGETRVRSRVREPLFVALEPQRIPGRHAPVALLETPGVGEKPDPLRRGQGVVELAVGTDVEPGEEVLLVDRLPAPLALGEAGVVERADPARGLGALRVYSRRLLSQFLMAPPRPHDAGERLAHLAQPLPGSPRSNSPDQPHQLAPDDDAVRSSPAASTAASGEPIPNPKRQAHRSSNAPAATARRRRRAGRRARPSPRRPRRSRRTRRPAHPPERAARPSRLVPRAGRRLRRLPKRAA